MIAAGLSGGLGEKVLLLKLYRITRFDSVLELGLGLICDFL